MKQITKTKILRKVLVLAFLMVGLAAVELNTDCYANAAIPCSELYQNYTNADNAYYTARVSYFNGSPTTCAQECAGNPNPTQCEQNCQTTRATALYSAELDMFEAAEGTCTPGTVHQCDQAQSNFNLCSVYDSGNYSDPDEAAAVHEQYMACRTASKIDSCY